MSFSVYNDYISRRRQPINPSGQEVIVERMTLQLAAADLAVNSIGAIGFLPAGCVPVGLQIDSDQFDSNGTPTLVWSIGLSNTNDYESALSSNSAQNPYTGAIASYTTLPGLAPGTVTMPASTANLVPAIYGTALSTLTQDGGAVWGSGITVSQAGGQVQVLSKALTRVQAVNYDRAILLLATAGAATAAAGSSKEIGINLFYRASSIPSELN